MPLHKSACKGVHSLSNLRNALSILLKVNPRGYPQQTLKNYV